MLDALIRISLRHRALVVAGALLLLLFGVQSGRQLPLEVLPDLTKPTVTVLTEAPGLAPEEVETLVTQPIEAALQGAAHLNRLRSNSDVGLSLVFAEFNWGTDLFRARQLIQERLQSVQNILPAGAESGLAPMTSLMGEILLVGLRSTNGALAPMDLRTLADWTVRRRLQSVPGVADVLTIGGGVRQIQVQPDPLRLAALGVTLEELEQAIAESADNATSGYLQAGPKELMIRSLSQTADTNQLGETVIKLVGGRPILLREVATLVPGVRPMRGDASVNGHPGVILSVDKSPGFDTLKVTEGVERALADLRPSLPAGVSVEVLFRQGDFIEHALTNLQKAIRDGALMVTVILLLFLLNVRTTLITLTAIPLSFAATLLVFRAFDLSVNAMTLGGLAVAIGLVVDDAIVDVENVLRRLRENASAARPWPTLEVVAGASGEVRNSILYATLLIILVFLPLLGLQGLEGRLFTPIAVATMVSMAASFVVSLTVIPVLCSLLLRPAAGREHPDGALVRGMKWVVRNTFLRLALGAPWLVLALVGCLLVGAVVLYSQLGRNFLPAFNEGSATISLAAAPGTSLAQANELGDVGVRLLLAIPEVKSVGRRTGRAERDDHVMPVSVNEFDVEFHPTGRPRPVVFEEIRRELATIPGTFVNVGQPLGHRLSHMLSGVSAKIAVKVYGPDLEVLRDLGRQIESVAREIPGLTDIYLERQVPIPQIRIEVRRAAAQAYGLTPGSINRQVATLVGGKTLQELREENRSIDLVLRLPESWRNSPERLGNVLLETPDQRRIPLRLVADLHLATGPNVINRENNQRRLALGINTSAGNLGELAQSLEDRVREEVRLPEGYFFSFEGEHQAQQAAGRRIWMLFSVVLVVVLLLLTSYFHSVSLALQVLLNLPLALIGGVALTWLVVGNISIATLVGFIAVGGIAARNGIMMLSHYHHLMKHEGEGFTEAMIIRGTLERLVPVLMTALSAGLALIPLLFAAHEPGTEILHPVAVVIVGGLASSTLLDLLVTPAVFWLFGRPPLSQINSTESSTLPV